MILTLMYMYIYSLCLPRLAQILSLRGLLSLKITTLAIDHFWTVFLIPLTMKIYIGTLALLWAAVINATVRVCAGSDKKQKLTLSGYPFKQHARAASA